MANDREVRQSQYKTDSLHLFLAIRRKKENRDIEGAEKVFRVIIRDEEADLMSLIAKIHKFPGIWRIYKTINPRNVTTAQKLMMKKLIDEPETWSYRIDSLWKTCLLQPECKIGKLKLIDVDTKELKTVSSIGLDIINSGGTVLSTVETPGGFHLVVDKFDSRIMEKYKDKAEMKRDAYVFVDRIEVK